MRRIIYGVALACLAAAACGGENAAVPPPQPPPVASVAPPAPEAPPAPPPEAPKPTMAELIKQNTIAGLAAFNAHDPKKYSEMFTADTSVTPFGQPELKGREAVAAWTQKFMTAFPDIKLGLSRVVESAKGDVVVSEWTAAGTNSGELMWGGKPTNKAVGVMGASVFWMSPEGLVQKGHFFFDDGTLAAQIGVSKMPARAVASVPNGEPEMHIAKDSPDEQKNIEILKSMYNAKNESDFVATAGDNIVWSDVSMPKDMTGKEDAKKFFKMMMKAFPDAAIKGDFWAADDLVIAEFNMTGTQKGPFGPLTKVTKKPVDMHGIDIAQIKDGKIVHGWTYVNSSEMLGQLGLLPKPKAEKPKDDKTKAGDKAKGDAPKTSDKPKGDAPKTSDKPKK